MRTFTEMSEEEMIQLGGGGVIGLGRVVRFASKKVLGPIGTLWDIYDGCVALYKYCKWYGKHPEVWINGSPTFD